MSEALRVVRTHEVTPEQMDLVRRTVATGATDDELKLYLYDCQRQGVHPLDKLLHFTKRGGRYVPITSIDLMRSRAGDTGELAGIDDAVFRGDGMQPESATVTVYRLTQGQRFGYTSTAYWAEYYPGDQQGHMWRKMPRIMLAKVAEASALRKGFPRQLAGLYERAEMDQADEGRRSRAVPEAEGLDEPLKPGEVLMAPPPERDPLADEVAAFKRRAASAEAIGVLTTGGSGPARMRWVSMALGKTIKKVADVTKDEWRQVNAKLLELMQAKVGANAFAREADAGAAPAGAAPNTVAAPNVEGTSPVGAHGVLETGAAASMETTLQESIEREKFRKAWFTLVDTGIRHQVPGFGAELKGNDKTASAARAALLSHQCGEVVEKFADASADQYERGCIVMREQLTAHIVGQPAK